MFSVLQRPAGRRLIFGFLIAFAIPCGIGTVAVVRLNQISATVDDVTDHLAVERALADDIVNQTSLVRFYASRYVRTQSQADLDQFNQAYSTLEALLIQADHQTTDPERVDMLNRIQPAVQGYGDAFHKIAQLIRQRQSIQSEALDVGTLTTENRLTALKIHTISLRDPFVFLSFGNAQNAFQLMRLNTSRYLASGDERYAILLEKAYQEAQSALLGLEAALQDPAQRENAAEAREATLAYHAGFQTIRAGYTQQNGLFRTELDTRESEASGTAAAMAASVEREFRARNNYSQALIAQTRFGLIGMTAIAALAGLLLSAVIYRRAAEREGAAQAFREARDQLEIRVHERTAELRAANAQLRQEIDKRERAERGIEERWLYLKAVLEAVPDAIVTLDARGQIVEWNSSAERLFGYSREEVVGRQLDSIITNGDTYAEAVKLTEETLSRAGVAPVETVRCRRDGSLVDVTLAASPVRVAGASIGAAAVYTDITERKLAEKQLERYAAELKQANEEVKQFAYIVSHDLRAPLVNLKGFSAELRFALEDIQRAIHQALPHLDEQQRQTLTTALEEEVPEALDFIESSVTRMDHFISAVLKLSRLGRRELRMEPLDMNVLVREVLEPLRHQIERNQVQVSVAELPTVVADRTAVEQIIGNILGNALKYLEPDRPGVIEVTASDGEDEFIIHVRDNGRGIAKDDMHKVFAPFRRAGRQDVPGEGMGLAYVQTLVRQRGGRIWCDSELGTGTTFHFTIPAGAQCET
ncbi:MAG: PAS domain S-box protein [Ardenticatenaceae bacterium]|nr:PAS domain S-box protein [Ardenticatenaceae bacterium]